MKKYITKHILLSASIAAFTSALAQAQTILFKDDFSRPANTNLNASTVGQSGTLAPLTWIEQNYNGTAAINTTGGLVIDATLTGGNDGALVFPDRNFTGLESFTVTIRLTAGGSNGDGRQAGFGVGASKAEVEALTAPSPGGGRPGDVFVAYDSIGAITGVQIFKNGVSAGFIGAIASPSYPAILSATFTYADMNAGSALNYEVFLNGSSLGTGSTTWSGTDENYIRFSSNYTANSDFDYVQVEVPGPPVLLATDPADNATSIVPSQNLVATFGEPVFLNTTGSVTIKNLTKATETVISLPGPDPDGTLSITGNVLTIDPTADLGVPGDEIAIEISADAIKDADGAFYAGILSTDDPNWSFTIDNIPPAPAYFHPIPGTSKAPLDGALFIAFDEAPVIGTGNLVLHRVSDNSIVETFNVASLTVNDNRVTIVPTVPLAYDTSYYVLIDSGAFTDNLGNEYGITDPAVWTFSTIANEPEMLFGDSFNREDGNDLDTSARGKYGTLGALTYTQRILGAGNVGNVELTSGQLLLESNENDGTAGALVYPEHNFIDAAIASAGGFSVSIDLNANLSGGGRYQSVALGRAAADIDSQTSLTASGSAATSDLVVALRNNDTLWIYENGTNVTGTGLTGAPATPTKMRIDCSLPNFTAGSTVNYSVFFDDSVTAFASGTFTWSGTDENYISLSSNLLLTFDVGERHALFDNLQIRTLSAGGSDFTAWQIANETEGGLNNDHDGDGVSNGVEYFIYGPVANSGFTALPSVTDTAGVLSVTWTHAAGYTGTYGPGGYEVEISSTLGSWTVAPTNVAPNIANTVYINGDNVTYTFPAGTKNFARLKVTGP